MNSLTPQQFFFDFFPNAYICAAAASGGQFEGNVIRPNTPPEKLHELLRTYQELNKSHHNIFFTPNGAETVEGRNSLSNLLKIHDSSHDPSTDTFTKGFNAWWIDIDIEATKKLASVDDDETLLLRKNKKAEITGQIFCMPSLPPSLTIETRNGFQLYWFIDKERSPFMTEESFLRVGNGLYEYFKLWGADRSTVKVMQLMRVPNFYYIKNGEIGQISIWPSLSPLTRYPEEKMLEVFGTNKTYSAAALVDGMSVKAYRPKYKKIAGTDPNDIFIKVVNMSIDEVLNKLSGHWLVQGDVITIMKQDTDKSNILVNSKPTPNFIIRSQNHIYSNNAAEKGPTIIQYLKWYGWTNGRIAEGLKELFNNPKTV